MYYVTICALNESDIDQEDDVENVSISFSAGVLRLRSKDRNIHTFRKKGKDEIKESSDS